MELATFKYEIGANLIFDESNINDNEVLFEMDERIREELIESKEEESTSCSDMDFAKEKARTTMRSSVCTSVSSSCSSMSERKRSSLSLLEASDSTSSTGSKRSRMCSSDSDLSELHGAFQAHANITAPHLASWNLPEVFDPRKMLPTVRNMKTAFAVISQAEARVRLLRIQLDKQPLNGEVRRAYLNACDYFELMSLFVRQDTIATEFAKEVFEESNASSKREGARLSLPEKEEDILPDILPANSQFKYINGSRLSKCLYGYIAKYHRVSNVSGDKAEEVAIKVSFKQQILLRQAMNGKFVQENPIRELRIQQAMFEQDPSRRDILPLDQVLESDDKLFAVYPFLDSDMFSYVVYRDRMTETEAKQIFRAMVESVKFCHASGVCHRDLSLENYLVRRVSSKKVEPVIIDFGLCTLMEPDRNSDAWLPINHTGAVGKYGYMAPEVYNQANARVYDGPAADVWSLGVCLFSMLTRFPPWEKPESSDKHFHYMVEGGGIQRYLEGNKIELSNESVKLMEGIFKVNPAERLTVSEILEHPWLQ